MFPFLLTVVFFELATRSAAKMSPCEVCEEFVEAFYKGLRETENRTYEGGSAAGQKMKVEYKNSELRFMTIIEGVCQNSAEKKMCLTLIDSHEDDMEDWFKNLFDFLVNRRETTDLRGRICVDVAKACCRDFHFGKDCAECLGIKERFLCSGKGKCDGERTRSGTGKCICDEGYAGDYCDECAENSFKRSKNTCVPCHVSCKGGCYNETVRGCKDGCKKGWVKEADVGCVDIDECELNITKCKYNEFCNNLPGSSECKSCHPNCLMCNGEFDVNCTICQLGLNKNEKNVCVDINECEANTHTCKGLTYCVNTYGSSECHDCHAGCATGCTGPSLDDCLDCKPGYREKDSGSGCVEINECEEKDDVCPPGNFCMNSPGSYSCTKCDDACTSCFGPGPHSCNSCSEEFYMNNGFCQEINPKDPNSDERDEL